MTQTKSEKQTEEEVKSIRYIVVNEEVQEKYDKLYLGFRKKYAEGLTSLLSDFLEVDLDFSTVDSDNYGSFRQSVAAEIMEKKNPKDEKYKNKKWLFFPDLFSEPELKQNAIAEWLDVMIEYGFLTRKENDIDARRELSKYVFRTIQLDKIHDLLGLKDMCAACHRGNVGCCDYSRYSEFRSRFDVYSRIPCNEDRPKYESPCSAEIIFEAYQVEEAYKNSLEKIEDRKSPCKFHSTGNGCALKFFKSEICVTYFCGTDKWVRDNFRGYSNYGDSMESRIELGYRQLIELEN
ncbi:hypothetical protein HOK51_09155 [Candidatus Woesearchaeota archaeon]|jgi:hypothetical protein|nr:hypothetical protein [Candidatus Woesearchaeota archaeon]MBT6519997.1 hypothetical protein [Candidatus Woesearchaeota archaeon]MBT7367756.1 hypothetical protein [Candidatus Woesearchaeota archaeon]